MEEEGPPPPPNRDIREVRVAAGALCSSTRGELFALRAVLEELAGRMVPVDMGRPPSIPTVAPIDVGTFCKAGARARQARHGRRDRRATAGARATLRAPGSGTGRTDGTGRYGSTAVLAPSWRPTVQSLSTSASTCSASAASRGRMPTMQRRGVPCCPMPRLPRRGWHSTVCAAAMRGAGGVATKSLGS